MSVSVQITAYMVDGQTRKTSLSWVDGETPDDFSRKKREYQDGYRTSIDVLIERCGGHIPFTHIDIMAKNYPMHGTATELRVFLAFTKGMLRELHRKYEDDIQWVEGAYADNKLVPGRTIEVYDLTKLSEKGGFLKMKGPDLTVLRAKVREHVEAVLRTAFA